MAKPVRLSTTLVVAYALAIATLGCEPSSLEWIYRPAEGLDVETVEGVIARIDTGGCAAGVAVYRESFSIGAVPPPPPPLASGRYGVSIALLDASCNVLGSRCMEVDLPRSDPVVFDVELMASGPACDAGETCNMGVCTRAGADAGADAPVTPCALDAMGAPECDRLGGGVGLCWSGVCCDECWDPAPGGGCRIGDRAPGRCGEGGVMCTSCPMGTTCTLGPAPFCRCAAGWHADGAGACVQCAPGMTRPEGDDPAGPATPCSAILCPQDYRVMTNACVACDSGFTNVAGDDSSMMDTPCDECGDAVQQGREMCDDGNVLPCGRCGTDCLSVGTGATCMINDRCGTDEDCMSGNCASGMCAA